MKARVELCRTTKGFYETDVPDYVVRKGSEAISAWLVSQKENFPIDRAVSNIEITKFMMLDKPAEFKEFHIAVPVSFIKYAGDEIVELFINKNKDRFVTLFRTSVQTDSNSCDDDLFNANMIYITLRSDLFYTIKELYSCNMRCGASAVIGKDLMEEMLNEGFEEVKF